MGGPRGQRDRAVELCVRSGHLRSVSVGCVRDAMCVQGAPRRRACAKIARALQQRDECGQSDVLAGAGTAPVRARRVGLRDAGVRRERAQLGAGVCRAPRRGEHALRLRAGCEHDLLAASGRAPRAGPARGNIPGYAARGAAARTGHDDEAIGPVWRTPGGGPARSGSAAEGHDHRFADGAAQGARDLSGPSAERRARARCAR
eukprot:2342309-Prymnesium_polylepis.2